MHQHAGKFSLTYFNERKVVGRSLKEREGRRMRVCVMISAVFFLPKLLCAARWSGGLQRDFGHLGVAHPGCLPPGALLV